LYETLLQNLDKATHSLNINYSVNNLQFSTNIWLDLRNRARYCS